MRLSLAVSAAPSVVALLSTLMMFSPPVAFAHGTQVVPHRVAALEVRGELPPPPAGVTNIKFGEFFRMPVGPRGLEPTEKLLALNGQRVRLVGYVVREEEPVPGRFLLSPLPVSLGDEDESLADDLPPTAVFVHLQGVKERNVPYIDGLVKLTGILEVGAKEEGGGRVSSIRLVLDSRASKQIFGAKPLLRASAK
jgi:hypothetical protein